MGQSTSALVKVMLAVVTSKVKWALHLMCNRMLAHRKQRLDIPSRVSGMQASLGLCRMTFKVTELVYIKPEEERVWEMMYGRNQRLRETNQFALGHAATLWWLRGPHSALSGSEAHIVCTECKLSVGDLSLPCTVLNYLRKWIYSWPLAMDPAHERWRSI